MADTTTATPLPTSTATTPAPTPTPPKSQDTSPTVAVPSVLTSAPAKDAVAKVGSTIDANAAKAQAKADAAYQAQVTQQQSSFGVNSAGQTIKATDPQVTAEMQYWAAKGTQITPDIALANVLSGKAASQNPQPATTTDTATKTTPGTTTTPTTTPTTTNTGAGTTTPPPTPTPTPQPTPDQQIKSSIDAINAQNAADHSNFNTQLDNIANGTYVTPEFVQQINDIKNSFNAAIQAQTLANDNAQTRLRQFGYTSGLSMISPSRFQSVLSDAANQGASKLADIANKESEAILNATQAFKQENYQLAIAKQQEADNYSTQKMDAAKELHQVSQDAITNARNQAADERQANLDALTIATGEQ